MKKESFPVMGVNTLVRHKKFADLGIGCISKVHDKHFTVNWGTDSKAKCLKTALVEVDTANCKTITTKEFQSVILSAGGKPDTVILGNEVKHYVGIGWVSHGVVTEADFKKYPRVIQ